ncbi:MAG: ECF transporter S component [Bacilli bacterium]
MSTKNLSIASIYIAFGIIIPLCTHYLAAGNIILPMHIPIIIAGFTLKPKYAIIVGFTTPILSFLITGMPIFFPMLPIMVAELTTYTIAGWYFKQKMRVNIYLSLILTMIVGRTIAAIIAQILIMGFNAPFESGIAFISAAITTGIIGIVIQILIIPPITKLIYTKLLT